MASQSHWLQEKETDLLPDSINWRSPETRDQPTRSGPEIQTLTNRERAKRWLYFHRSLPTGNNSKGLTSESLRQPPTYLAGWCDCKIGVASVELSAETSHCRGYLLAIAELSSGRFLHDSNALIAKDPRKPDRRRVALSSAKLRPI